MATISLGLYEGPLLTIIHVYRGVKTGSKSALQHIKQGIHFPLVRAQNIYDYETPESV